MRGFGWLGFLVGSACVHQAAVAPPLPVGTTAFQRGLALSEGGTASVEACEAFQAAVDAGAGAAASFNAGICALRVGWLERAEHQLRRALRTDPRHRPAQQALADVLERRGQHREALPLRQQLAEAGAPHARLAWVRTLGLSGEVPRATSVLREMLQLDPDHVGALVVLAELLLVSDDPAAPLVVERALTLAPSASLHNQQALIAWEEQDVPRAVQELRAAIAIDPSDFAAQMNFGWLALDAGDFSHARRAFQAALVQHPGDPDAMHGLAIAQRGDGDPVASAQTYTALLERAPTNDVVRLNASLLQARSLRDYDAALAVIEPVAGDAAAHRRNEIAAWQDADGPAPAPDDKAGRASIRALAKVLPDWRQELSTLRSCLPADAAASMDLILAQAHEVVAREDAADAREMKVIWDSYADARAACAAALDR